MQGVVKLDLHNLHNNNNNGNQHSNNNNNEFQGDAHSVSTSVSASSKLVKESYWHPAAHEFLGEVVFAEKSGRGAGENFMSIYSMLL